MFRWDRSRRASDSRSLIKLIRGRKLSSKKKFVEENQPLTADSGRGRKPTAKQERFADLVAGGSRQVDAYREAYDSHGSKNSQRVSASRLAASPNVARMIGEKHAEIQRVAARTARSRAGWIIERLIREAEDLENTGAIRVKALEVLGKASGLFSGEADRAERRRNATEAELQSELEARLAEFLPGIGVLEGEAKVIPQGSDDDAEGG
jgi:hypothetical protein